jgi:hypothetical protein
MLTVTVNATGEVLKAPHPVRVKAPLHGIAAFVFQLIFGEQMACTALRLEAHPPPPPGGVARYHCYSRRKSKLVPVYVLST